MKREEALEMSAKGGAIREGQVEKQDGVLQSGRGHLGNVSMGSRLRSCRGARGGWKSPCCALRVCGW